MKVLQIGQLPTEMGGNYTTGIARVVGEISKCRFGNYEIVFFATNLPEKKASFLKGGSSFRGYVLSPFGMLAQMLSHPVRTIREWCDYYAKGLNNPLHMEFMKYNFSRVIASEKPDLIHIHGAGLDALYNADRRFGKPIIYTLHGLMWDGDEGGDKQNRDYYRMYKYLLPLADFYSTLNEKARSKMLSLGVNPEKINIIPNGVDSKKYHYSEEARVSMRANMSVSAFTKVFVTIGLVIDRKGQFSFLKLLEAGDLDFQYWIIGEGPDVQPIREYTATHNLNEKVRLLGYHKDVELHKYLSAADFYAHASTIEGQALSEIEAYSTGLRIVLNSKISDTVIGDTEDKYRYHVADFDRFDYDSFIGWVSADNGKKRESTRKYDWEFIAAQYAGLYDKVIQKTGK